MNAFYPDTLQEWVTFIASAGALLVTFALLYLGSKFVSKAEHDKQTSTLGDAIRKLGEKIEERDDAIGLRLNQVEADLKTKPDHREIAALGDRIAGVERGVAVVAEKVSGLQTTIQKSDHSLGLIVEHLIKREGGK